MALNDRRIHQQFGALPFVIDQDGGARVMLVTSRGNGGWIIPKGWPIRNLSPADTAAREAFEEAGLVGEIVHHEPVGSYRYAKRRGAGKTLFEVSVFLFAVERQLSRWPEKAQRKTRWFDPEEAVARAAWPDLADILKAAAPLFPGHAHRFMPPALAG